MLNVYDTRARNAMLPSSSNMSNVISNKQLLEQQCKDWELLFFTAFLFCVCQEVVFFYTHRFQHKFSMLYRNVHKKHHEYTAPFGYVSQYAHWLDHIVSNLGPVIVGMVATTM